MLDPLRRGHRNARTSVIAGAANNILVKPAAGNEFVRRGIVRTPDFVANTGVASTSSGARSSDGRPSSDTLDRVFAEARALATGPE